MSSEQSDYEFEQISTGTYNIQALPNDKHCVLYDLDVSVVHSEAWGLCVQPFCIMCKCQMTPLKTRHVISYDVVEGAIHRNEVSVCRNCEDRHFNQQPEFPPDTPADQRTARPEGYAVPIHLGNKYNFIRNTNWDSYSFSTLIPGLTRLIDLTVKRDTLVYRRFIHFCADAIQNVYVLAYRDPEPADNKRKVKFLRRRAICSTLSNDPESVALLCMGAIPGNIPDIAMVFDRELIDMYRMNRLLEVMGGRSPAAESPNVDSIYVAKSTSRYKRRAPISQEQPEQVPEPNPKRKKTEYGTSSSDESSFDD